MPYKKTGCSRPCRNVGQKSNVMICPKLLLTIAFPQITCYDFVLCLQTIGCWQHSLQVSQSWATSSHCVSCWNTFDRCSPPINCFCSSQNGNSVFKRLPTLKKWKPAKPTPSRPLRTRRKWSYPSFSHAVPANKGGNVAKWRSRKAADIHESFCRANLQNTAGGKWRDPRHLPTSSVQSDMGSLKIHKLKPQPCLLPYLYEPFNSSSTNAATSSTSEPSKPSWKSILNHCGGTSGVRHW